MIKLNDNFKTKHDGRQWILYETYMGECRVKGKLTGESKAMVRESYHGTLRQACNKVVDASTVDCEDAMAIMDMIGKAGWVLEGQASGYLEGGK